MDFGPSYVPAELLVAVIQMLPVVDLKRIRQVCRGLDAVASQFLFESIYISTQLRDRENLTSISNHPTLSQTVKEIIYDSTYVCITNPLTGQRLNKTNYLELFSFVDETISKAAIGRGFNRFQACLRDQMDIIAYCGEDLTNPRDAAALPANFSSLLEDHRSHAAVAIYLPEVLVRLVDALPKLPNTRRFAVSDRRHTKNRKHRSFAFRDDGIRGAPNLTYSIQNKGIRGWDAAVLDPRPWPEPGENDDPKSDRSWYRGFSVLMQAASMTNMNRLESFKIECDSERSGLSHSILDMSSSELHHAINVFRNMRTIDLKIDSKTVGDRRPGMTGDQTWPRTLESGSIAKILSAATHLETLKLELEDAFCDTPGEIPSLTNLLGTETWPHLRHLRLGHMVLHENQFLKFFNRQCHTLQSLRLEQIALFPDRWVTEREENSTCRRWGNIFRTMAANHIVLTSFDMHFHTWDDFNFTRAECIRHHARGAIEVLQLLESGGTKRKRRPCGY